MAFVSGLTLVACDETESRTKTYADLAEAVRRYCHPELFKRMVFNILVSNDDHLRNHGFIWDSRLPGWRLSPLNDVLPRASHSTERNLHLGVGPQGRLASLDNALAAHEKFHAIARAYQLIDEVWRTVRQWQICFDEAGVPDAEQAKISAAFRDIDDVSTPALRKLL